MGDAANPSLQKAPLTPVAGFVVLFAVVAAVAGYLMIAAAAGIEGMWAGFLWLLCWAAIEHMEKSKFGACLIGSFCGLLMAWLLHAGPAAAGAAGLVPALLLVLAAIYCQIMGWLPVAINIATMLFLTVGTIPAVQQRADFADMAMAILLAALWFGAIGWGVARLTPKPHPAPETI